MATSIRQSPRYDIIVQFSEGEDNRHTCKIQDDLEIIFHGGAVEHCESDQEGRLWVRTHNDEYGNEVLFCPFCGTASSRTKD